MRLRIEDLDAERAQAEHIDGCRRDLEWLGLDWDGEVIVQSKGLEEINARVDDLLRRGLVYPCVCSRADIRAAQSAPQGRVTSPYPGTCRDKFTSVEEAERKTGRDAGLRFRVPSGSVEVVDRLAPRLEVDLQSEVGDFLVARRNGLPAYQIAVVVDDARQGITEVLRGDDLLASTPAQKVLQEALGYAHPEWVHVPLVTDRTGRRLAKRADDLSLAELRAGGTDPRAIVAWTARGAGMPTGERASAAQLVGELDLARLPRDPVTLDEASLDALREARL